MRRFRRRKRPHLLPIILLLLPLLGFLLFEKAAAPVLMQEAMVAAHAQAVRAIEQSVAELAAREGGYEALMHIERDAEGRILLVIPDSAAINARLSSLTLAVEERLARLREQSVVLPLGIVTGSRLLADSGPPIKVKVRTLGALHAQLSDDFLAVGVNQSRHRVSVRLTAQLAISIPFHAESFEAAGEGVLCETIIVGPVPQTYLHFQLP